jgi:deazaflavin-dependent oxidoreductase (nitroreductase family)
MNEDDIELNWTELNKVSAEVGSSDGPGSTGWNPEHSQTNRFNEALMNAFRKNNGKVPGELEDVPMLIITTTGAKTGKRRAIPLAYQVIDDRLLIIASMAGADRHPPWFHNLVRHPEVAVEMGGETFTAHAVVTEGEDRDDVFQRICKNFELFADYQARTDRQIPVVELKRLSGTAT